jgi:glycine/D-amino acid oxidase-like deaminating enzyme
MSKLTAEVVICGAGIAGVAAAYELAVVRGARDVLLVEQGDPLALTSDKSTEAYRNWWPDPAMVALMGRSLDRVEAIARASDNAILLNRRGYLYATGDAPGLPTFRASAEAISALGTGPLRVHGPGGGGAPYSPAPAHGFEGEPDGADLILDRALLREHFPYLGEGVVAALHVRRAGWFGARQLGMLMLEAAREAGARLVRGRVAAVETAGGRVRAVRVETPDGEQRVATPAFVSAAGPLQAEVAGLLGLELPLYSERHLKVSFNDVLGIIPRHAPMLIWNDPVRLPWSEAERVELADDPELRPLLGELPAGAHCRPEGGPGASAVLLLWDYHAPRITPVFPVEGDPLLAELALRGLSAMLPGLAAYLERLPQTYMDGGYYTRTRENRPLIGPLPVAGAYIVGGLSGYGLMAACGAAELLGAHLTGAALPEHAAAFAPARYDDPAYVASLESWGDVGQL